MQLDGWAPGMSSGSARKGMRPHRSGVSFLGSGDSRGVDPFRRSGWQGVGRLPGNKGGTSNLVCTRGWRSVPNAPLPKRFSVKVPRRFGTSLLYPAPAALDTARTPYSVVGNESDPPWSSAVQQAGTRRIEIDLSQCLGQLRSTIHVAWKCAETLCSKMFNRRSVHGYYLREQTQ